MTLFNSACSRWILNCCNPAPAAVSVQPAMPDRTKCPNCGERVSPYAAGCAVCGADLDPSRWDTGPSFGQRISSLFGAISMGGYGYRALVAVLVIAFVVLYLGLF
jgi:predicted amidophosphoribosyltransferase